MTAIETAGWLLLWYAIGAAGAFVVTYVLRPALKLAVRRIPEPSADLLIRVFVVLAGGVIGAVGFVEAAGSETLATRVAGSVVGAFGGATSAWAVARWKERATAWAARTFGGQTGRDDG